MMNTTESATDSTTNEVRYSQEVMDLLQQLQNGLARYVREETKKIACKRREEVCRITADDVLEALPVAVRRLLEERGRK